MTVLNGIAKQILHRPFEQLNIAVDPNAFIIARYADTYFARFGVIGNSAVGDIDNRVHIHRA